MLPDPVTGKSRVYVDGADIDRWRKADGHIQIFIPTAADLSAETWTWLTRVMSALDVLHDGQEEPHVGSRLTVLGQTYVVIELRKAYPMPGLDTAWARPWTHWEHLGG